MTSTDTFLASGLFGDASALGSDLDIFQRGLAEALTSHLGTEFPMPTHDNVAMSLWRSTVEGAFKALSRGGDRVEVTATLSRTRCLIEAAAAAPALDETDASYILVPAGATSTATPSSTMWQRALQDLAPSNAVQHDPDQSAYASLHRARALLEKSLPLAAPASLGRVYGAFIVDSADLESAFVVPAPGLSVLNFKIFSDDVALGDAMLHEATHQKLYDLIATRYILTPGHDFSGGPVYDLPWGYVAGEPRKMDNLRIVSSLHVYVHIFAYLLELKKSEHNSATLDDRLLDYWARMQFFWCVAERGGLKEGFGRDGRDLVTWIVEACHLHRSDMKDLGHEVDDTYTAAAERQIQAS